ncbi:hypothetical protein Esi_0037_0053 [Ectocarpus siliculosus]|uniref:Uncharacterized protein n=1 Tax=Ectocarpus siliculosus TaxID=2880 RepID=D8LLL7_ECTSI|nr:hypothetical protein Esi_0037_0053 [Ectocarpus siliculosus]|eukprot:CBN74648.1 hypothetical protein Esi_0037_0053 [Ectocarpus siliculosus]
MAITGGALQRGRTEAALAAAAPAAAAAAAQAAAPATAATTAPAPAVATAGVGDGVKKRSHAELDMVDSLLEEASKKPAASDHAGDTAKPLYEVTAQRQDVVFVCTYGGNENAARAALVPWFGGERP